MKEIIFDLLSVGKSPKTFTINPEVKKHVICLQRGNGTLGDFLGESG